MEKLYCSWKSVLKKKIVREENSRTGQSGFHINFSFLQEKNKQYCVWNLILKHSHKAFLIIKMSTRKKKLSSLKNLVKANVVKKQLREKNETPVGRKKKKLVPA